MACDPSEKKEEPSSNISHLIPVQTIQYAKRFSMAANSDYKALFLYGDRETNDTSSVFILYKNEKPVTHFKNAYYVKVPVTTIACMSSIYAAMLSKMNLVKNIVAVDNADYYNNEFILESVKNASIKELAKGPDMNVEQTLLLNPNLILTFGMGDPHRDVTEKILNSKIPVAISLDHLEEHPLARAEWIKFIAAFFQKDDLADSLFNITQERYNHHKKLCDSVRSKPTVLTEIKYADAWYVPGGKSFMAHLLNDAGADYLWKDEQKVGSIALNFEAVYTKAKDADYWINLFVNINSKKELVAFDERYAMFAAYKSGNLFNNNNRVNAKGYSDYWENGITNPDELLEDLIKIVHPELLPNYKLKYYKKID